MTGLWPGSPEALARMLFRNDLEKSTDSTFKLASPGKYFPATLTLAMPKKLENAVDITSRHFSNRIECCATAPLSGDVQVL